MNWLYRILRSESTVDVFESLYNIILLCFEKETEGEKSGTAEAEKDAEKKTKPKKKSKISEDITVDLVIKDILDPSADDLTSSKKK